VKADYHLDAKNQPIVAFDNFAGRYDDLFSRQRIGTQRAAVWEVLADTFLPGDEILALNCRNEQDALFLALLDVSVVTCDAAEGTIDVAPNRVALFDGAFSNFSGLNGIADLNQTARDLASLVRIGAPVIICLSSRFCLSETLWFLLHGKSRKAFRRCMGIATVKVGDCTVRMHYPTFREVRKLFSPSFLMLSCSGIGVAVPPSYQEPILRKYPRVLGLLRLIDRSISHLPLFRTIGDHMLLRFELVDGVMSSSQASAGQ
jgi:hypothetical protein